MAQALARLFAAVAGGWQHRTKKAFGDVIHAAFGTAAGQGTKERSQTEALVLMCIAIIAKKVCYRGSEAKPRDIFDIAAARSQLVEVVNALRALPEQVARTRQRLEKLTRNSSAARSRS